MADKGKDTPVFREAKSYPKEETFVDANEAARELKSTSIGAFSEANSQLNPTFGIDPDKSSVAYSAFHPSNNFSWTDRIFIPKPLQTLSKDPNRFYHAYPGIYVFHYLLNNDRFKKSVEEFEETQHFFHERLLAKEAGSVKAQEYSFDAGAFLTEFYERYPEPSCIFTNLYGGSLLIGDKDVLQKTMNFLKSSPNNAPLLMLQLGIPSDFIDKDTKRNQKINLYDLVIKPKEEVRYQLIATTQ